jgi:hypothetical protein
MAPHVVKHREARSIGGTPMITPKSSAHDAHTTTTTRRPPRPARCAGCGAAFARGDLVEVHAEHVAHGHGVSEGEPLCRPCAVRAGVR